MAARAIASLSLSFGLVTIPVKLYSATESSTAIRFKLMARGGGRVRQQYVAQGDEDFGESPGLRSASAESQAFPQAAEELSRPQRAEAAPALAALAREEEGRGEGRRTGAPDAPDDVEEPPAPAGSLVERQELLKGYEFEKGKYVLFTPQELKALQAASRDSIDIVAFIPEGAVDPLFYDKAYYAAPERRGERPYALLREAMVRTGRCALAKWAWRGKEVVVQIRPAGPALVLQQLRYADEVRPASALDIPEAQVSEPEIALAGKLIAQIALDAYDPAQFVDEEKQRILAAVEAKIAGRRIVAPRRPGATGAQVIDLMEALRASLAPARPRRPARKAAKAAPAPKARARK